MWEDSKAAFMRGDYAEEVKILLLLATAGDARAQYNLGVMYHDGESVLKNDKEAVKWYQLAADQGYAGAQFNLGVSYYNGEGVPKDYKEAAKWFQLAADQGDAVAQFDLGVMYDLGQGLPKDYKEGAKWYRLSADQGDVAGQRNLGVMYDSGHGVSKDYKEATKWLRRAADQGDGRAQMFLGDEYRQGRGVPKDYVLAYMWLNLAAANLDAYLAPVASKWRDEVAALMTPGQIAEAQRLSSQWQPKRPALASQDSANAPTGKSAGGQGAGAAAANAPEAKDQPPSAREVPADALLGSGFFVAEDGSTLTNAHVVDRCKDIRIAAPAGAGMARILARDSTNDLALLATTLRPASVATWRTGVRQGEDIAIYGFPLAGLLADSGGITTGTVAALAGPADDSRLLQITAPVQPGNSGGPVLDRSGNVVGVVVSKLDALGIARITNDIPENVGFAIKWSVVGSFLEGRKGIQQGAAATAPLSTPDIATKARAFTVRIECDR